MRQDFRHKDGAYGFSIGQYDRGINNKCVMKFTPRYYDATKLLRRPVPRLQAQEYQ